MNYGDIFVSDSQGLDFLSAPDKFDIQHSKIYSITQQFVGKPWVIAQVEYSDFSLWWAIAKANNVRIPMIMRDTFRVREGKPNVDNIITDFYLGRKIIIPSLTDINKYIEKIGK
jgi:hypothetical protein